MDTAQGLDGLRHDGRMRWLDGAQGWRAEPDEVVSALAAQGFEEYKRETARTPRDGTITGGVWQGLDHRTGAVASTVWTRDPTGASVVFISIDGDPIKGSE